MFEQVTICSPDNASKSCDRMRYSVDSDQAAHKEQSDQGLHCFLIPVCRELFG